MAQFSAAEIRVDDTHASQLPVDMRGRKDLLCIKNDIVVGDLNPGHALGMKEVGDRNVEAAKKTLQRNFQNAEFCDVYLNSVIRDGGDCANQFDG